MSEITTRPSLPSPLLAIHDAAYRAAVASECIPCDEMLAASDAWGHYYAATHELLVAIMGEPSWQWRPEQKRAMIAERSKK